ncbi:MAG: redox-sensing transcriptional repressor Rex [Spirochaetia bacterium]|nr:redox-sensing transcriptional repressor Rex [Spirochaetia bacterium]
MAKENLPVQAITRLCLLYRVLEGMDRNEILTSSSLEKLTKISACTIRKDLSLAGKLKSSTQGYSAGELADFIKDLFRFDRPVRVCIAGIGLLGSSFIKNPVIENGQYMIVAGFDSNINRLEVMRTSVPLFPACEMTDRIKEMNIDFGIIAVPAQAAESTLQRMKEGGIKGILNFSSAILGDKDIIVRNVHFTEELRFLSAMIPSIQKE